MPDTVLEIPKGQERQESQSLDLIPVLALVDRLARVEERVGFTYAWTLKGATKDDIQTLKNDIKTLDKNSDVKFENLERSMNARFEAMDTRFATIDTRFATIDSKFAAIDSKFAAIDSKFEAMDSKFEAKFEAMDSKFEAKFGNLERSMDVKFEATNNKIEELGKVVATATGRFDGMKTTITVGIAVMCALLAGMVTVITKLFLPG
ncbi:MAG: hypothetical protein LBQ12_02270 [Deltaproteobacteria bacterium]|nr:hypothetical protein [Deltaproteobacteria bacterium]